MCSQIHRPEKKNAMTPEMYAGLSEAIRTADGDDSIRVTILYGLEGCFTSGNDLGNFRDAPPLTESIHTTSIAMLCDMLKNWLLLPSAASH